MSLFLHLSPALGGMEDYAKRIQELDRFSSEIPTTLEEFQNLEKNIREFQDPKLLKSEKEILSLLLKEIKATKDNVEQSSDLLGTSLAKENLEEIKKLQAQMDEYKQKNDRKLQLQNDPQDSKRLKKFYQLTQQGKTNLAQAVYLTLGKDEKTRADEYDRLNDFLLYNQSMVEVWRSQLKTSENSLLQKLTFLEEVQKEIQSQYASIEQKRTEFEKVKSNLNVIQYQLQLNDMWKLGQFQCSKDAVYQKPLHQPDLLYLRNGGDLKSVIRLDPSQPNQYSIVYSCRKTGKYGGCLDDESKAICRLDSSCKESLENSEKRYTVDGFFSLLKDTLPSRIVSDLLKQYDDKNNQTALNIFEEMNRLGYYSRSELVDFCRPLLNLTQTLTAKTASEYFSKFKIEAKKLMDQRIAGIKSRKPKDPEKADQSEKVVSYLFTSFQSEMEKLINLDFMDQEAYSLCGTIAAIDADYCQNSREWREKKKAFDAIEEVKSLTPGRECELGTVLRYPLSMNSNEEKGCIKNDFKETHSAQKLLKEMKNSLKNP